MSVVYLGNVSVVVPQGEAQAVTHSADEVPPVPDNKVHRPDLSQQVTTISLGEGGTVADVAACWQAHSAAAPAWVESDDEVLEQQVAEHFGCPVGCPDNGDPDTHNHDTWKEG